MPVGVYRVSSSAYRGFRGYGVLLVSRGAIGVLLRAIGVLSVARGAVGAMGLCRCLWELWGSSGAYGAVEIGRAHV